MKITNITDKRRGFMKEKINRDEEDAKGIREK